MAKTCTARTPNPENEADEELPRCARSGMVFIRFPTGQKKGELLGMINMIRDSFGLPARYLGHGSPDNLKNAQKPCPSRPCFALSDSLVCKGFGCEWAKREENPP